MPLDPTIGTAFAMKKRVSDGKNEVTLKIKVEPRSSRAGVVGPYGDALKVKLTSPPVEGRANKELIEVLSKEFGVPKRDIEIISGQGSKNKVVKLCNVKNIEEKLMNRMPDYPDESGRP